MRQGEGVAVCREGRARTGRLVPCLVRASQTCRHSEQAQHQAVV